MHKPTKSESNAARVRPDRFGSIQPNTGKQNTTVANVRKAARKAAKKEAKKEVQREGLGAFRSKDILPKVLPGAVRDEVKTIISAMAAPKEAEPIRFVSEFTTQSTAVAHPYEVHDAEFNTIGETVAMVFRDPVRSCVEYHTVNGATVYQAKTVTFGGVESSSFTLAAAAPNNVLITPNEMVFPNISKFDYVSGDPFNGQTMGVGVAPQLEYGAVWLEDPNTQLSITTTALLGGTPSMTPILYKWDGMNFVEARNSANIVGTGTTTTGIQAAADRGYYVLGFRNSSGSNCTSFVFTLQLTYPDAASVYAHKAIPFLENHFLSADDIRINALSLMLTNKAAPISRSGQVAAVQSPAGIPWSAWSFSNVSTANEGKVLEAVNGIYIFGKPTQPGDFDYRDPITNNAVVEFKVSFPLRDDRQYLVIAAKIPDAAGQSCYWTRAYGIEFVTSDQWYDRCRPEMSEDIFRQTLVIIRDLEAIHENPLHWSDILNFAKKVAKGVITYGPTVMSIAKLLA